MISKKSPNRSLLVWILQTGEPLQIDESNSRPMRAISLCNAALESGHRVVLWSSVFYHQTKQHRKYYSGDIKVSNHLKIRLIPSIGYKRNIGLDRIVDHAQMGLNLKKALGRVDELPDVAFIGYPPIEISAVLARWLSIRGIPSLLDVKDQWPQYFVDAVPAQLKPLARWALWPYFYLARRAMRDATGIAAMADSFLDWALDFAGRKKNKMDGVFPLTAPKGQATKAQIAEARQWWDSKGVIDDGRNRVCFVGSHTDAFNFLPVFEAAKAEAKNNVSCQFVICGDGDGSEGLRKMMSGLSNVIFPGWIDSPKIEVLAERSQAALAPYINHDSFTRSIPNKVIDALSFGLPILCPLKGEVGALIRSYNVGISYGTDSGVKLDDCIQALRNDPGMTQNMSHNALRLYKDRFSYEVVYGGLVKHLEMLSCPQG